MSYCVVANIVKVIKNLQPLLIDSRLTMSDHVAAVCRAGYRLSVSRQVDFKLAVLNINKCKKLKQFKTRCKDDMVNSDN